jgi:hypothetical protein
MVSVCDEIDAVVQGVCSASWPSEHRSMYTALYQLTNVKTRVCFLRTGALFNCTCWYLSLLQYRGARWFEQLVQLPGEERDDASKRCRLPSLSTVLDTVQGPLGPFIVLGLWILLVTGLLPRSWFYNSSMMANLFFGVRGFVAVVRSRGTTIRRVSVLQNQAPGTVADKRRRMGTLKRKTIGLIADLIIIFVSNVSVCASFLIAGSFFSSRRAIVNFAVGETCSVLSGLAVSKAMHDKVRKARRKHVLIQHMQPRLSRMLTAQAKDSAVEPDGIGGESFRKKSTKVHGLFSEVQTNE